MFHKKNADKASVGIKRERAEARERACNSKRVLSSIVSVKQQDENVSSAMPTAFYNHSKEASKISVVFCYHGPFLSVGRMQHIGMRDVFHPIWISLHDKRILITKCHRNVYVFPLFMQEVYEIMIEVNPQPDCFAGAHALRGISLAFITS